MFSNIRSLTSSRPMISDQDIWVLSQSISCSIWSTREGSRPSFKAYSCIGLSSFYSKFYFEFRFDLKRLLLRPPTTPCLASITGLFALPQANSLGLGAFFSSSCCSNTTPINRFLFSGFGRLVFSKYENSFFSYFL